MLQQKQQPGKQQQKRQGGQPQKAAAAGGKQKQQPGKKQNQQRGNKQQQGKQGGAKKQPSDSFKGIICLAQLAEKAQFYDYLLCQLLQPPRPIWIWRWINVSASGGTMSNVSDTSKFIFCVFSIDWFKAGKGPDPNKASLDREMDDYFKQNATKSSSTESETAN